MDKNEKARLRSSVLLINFKFKSNYKTHAIVGVRAFTLAEVLITLGIIGVVAAMTIPTLINNYQKQETVSRLQKIYSIISSAVKMSELQNGSSTTWDSPTIDNDLTQSTDWWNKYFIPYANLSVIKTCTTANSSECWPSDSKWLDGASNSTTYFLDWVLADGITMNFRPLNSQYGGIMVDINGLKKPNIMGRDEFYIIVSYKAGYVSFVGRGLARTSLLTGASSACNSDLGTNKGLYCGALIQADGWQIKDDYPWD